MTMILSAEIRLCKINRTQGLIIFSATIRARGFSRENDENAMNFKTQFNRPFRQREVNQWTVDRCEWQPTGDNARSTCESTMERALIT